MHTVKLKVDLDAHNVSLCFRFLNAEVLHGNTCFFFNLFIYFFIQITSYKASEATVV